MTEHGGRKRSLSSRAFSVANLEFAERARRREEREQFNQILLTFAQSSNQLSANQSSTSTVIRNIESELTQKKDSRTSYSKLSPESWTVFIRGSATDAYLKPTEVVPSCAKLFEANTNHGSYTLLHSMMVKADPTSHYSASHSELMFKDGVVWHDTSVPELLTFFATFPNGALARKMNQDAKDYEQRQRLEIELNVENVAYLQKLHLFVPQNLLEAQRSVCTFCILLEVFFGAQSILYRTVREMLLHMDRKPSDFTRC
jgi:hypothetical protein